MMRVVVDLNQSDIDGGECRNPHLCSVALATVRALNGSEDVSVGPKVVYLIDTETGTVKAIAPLPRAAKAIIHAVDNGYKHFATPTRFTLNFKPV
jgi:hypothetical protein